MKINIIGSGWLAQPLAQQLIINGHQLLLTTTKDKKLKQLQANNFNVIKYQLGEQFTELNKLFDTDVLIIAITNKDIRAFSELMDQLSKHACKNLIYISSTSVYQNNGQTHDENSVEINTESPIRQIEQLIQQHPSTTIIRFAGLVGPKRHPGRFFQQGRKLKNPSAPINLIHLDDCIGIIKTIIDQAAWNQVFNGCADSHPSKLEFYTHMANQLNLTAPEIEQSTTGSQKIIDNQKSKTALGYEYKYPDVYDMKY